jgi:hypothetical protein
MIAQAAGDAGLLWNVNGSHSCGLREEQNRRPRASENRDSTGTGVYFVAQRRCTRLTMS